MIARFLAWRAKRREQRELVLENAGYDYAAGALLRGEETPISLEAQWWRNPYFGAFDRGIMRATYRLIDLGVIVDDSI
jgi:hypothetical protein